MAGLSAYTVTPRALRKHVIRIISRGLVPFIKSSPGIGKSSIVRSIAKQFNLKVIDHRMSTSLPEDFNGLPKFDQDVATFVPYDLFPTENTPLPEGCDGWVLFLDEFNAALDKGVQAGAYKLILDKMVGQHRLHPNVVIVCAGNLMTDRAIVSELSTAMKSRLIHLKLVHSFIEWLEDVAIAERYDRRVISYLSFNEKALMDFNPETDEETFNCPRTWEFMNALIKGVEYAVTEKNGRKIYEIDDDAPIFAGTITSGTALEFIEFTKVEDSLPKVPEILKDPVGAKLPGDSKTRFLMTTTLVEHVDDQTLPAIGAYIERLPVTFQILFYRAIVNQQPALAQHATVAKAMVIVGKYLYDGVPIPQAA